MSGYTIRPGDTFESIARKQYGSEEYADLIRSANPGAVEPLTPGQSLGTPTNPRAPRDNVARAPAADLDEVAIRINGQRFRFWASVRITRSIDNQDTVEFSAPFDSDAPGFRDVFKPFSYLPADVFVGGDPLFTGTMIGVLPEVRPGEKTIRVSAYSLPGVLNDCTPPASAYPIEFNNMRLDAIAAALAKPFGVSVVFTGPVGAPFERAAPDPSETVLAFLADLARQRGLIISSTPTGELLFQQSIEPGEPVAILAEGVSPVIEVRPAFSPQQYYSHITGLEPVNVGTDGSQYTVKNPHLAGVVRPLTFKAPDVEGADIKDAVAAKVGRMYGNMAAYSVRVDTWRDNSGALWKPNTTIKLHAPDGMVYEPYEFILRSVAFDRDAGQSSAVLDLVLPGAFSGKNPEALPWA